MPVSMKTRLSTKKADRLLSKELKEYIMELGNNKKAAAVLQFVYSLRKQEPSLSTDEIIGQIEERFQVVDTYYKPENDRYEKFLLYSVMFRSVGKVSPETLKRYGNIRFTDSFSRYISEELFYMQYYLVTYGVPDADISLLIDDTIKVREINRNCTDADGYPEWICESVYDTFFRALLWNDFPVEDKFVRLANAPLIRELLSRKAHISKKTQISGKREYLADLCEKLHLADCEKDENGFIIVKNRFANYYAKPAMEFIAKQPENKGTEWVYTTSDAMSLNLGHIPGYLTFHDIPFSKVKLQVKDDLTLLIIDHSGSTKSTVDEKNERHFYPGEDKKAYTFFAYEKEHIYAKTPLSARTRPATLGDLVKAALTCKKAHDVILGWMEYLSADTPFFRDFTKVFEDSVSAGYPLFPVMINDIFIYHNWAEYFRTKYKTAKKLEVNYNKLPPHASYAIITVSPHVVPSDIPVFVDYVRKHPQAAMCIGNKKVRTKIYLMKFYTDRIVFGDDNGLSVLPDWIDMAIQMKEKLSLRKTSAKKVMEAHDRLSEKQWEKEHKDFADYSILPEKSRFDGLRKLLPESFERIETKKRLEQESMMQHHCVWSYEDRIKRDICSIYSYVSPATGMRHTIEFVKHKDRYVVNQIQKYRNRGYDKEVADTLTTYLGDDIWR